jgi:hypothetical protein
MAMTADAIIISYPKSGRTWLRQIFECAGADVAVAHAGSGTNGPQVGRHYKQLAFKHHKYTRSKVVFLHRHPIDTAVSNFWQMQKRELPRWSNFRLFLMRLRKRLPPDSIDEFVLSPRYGVEKICVYNLQWSKLLAPRPDVMFTSYERLSAHTAAEAARLLAFVRPDLLKHMDIDEIVRKSSFREMQQAEIAHPKHALTGPESLKVRRGTVGGYTDELTTETIKRAEAIMARMSYEQGMHDFA